MLFRIRNELKRERTSIGHRGGAAGASAAAATSRRDGFRVLGGFFFVICFGQLFAWFRCVAPAMENLCYHEKLIVIII